MDPVGLAAGAALIASGYGLGRWQRTPPAPPPAPLPGSPICGCGHHRSFHADAGRCAFIQVNEQKSESLIYDKKNNVVRDSEDEPVWESTIRRIEVPCKCPQYIGPEPIPSYYSPEIGG